PRRIPPPSSPRSRSPGRRPSPASCPARGYACPTTPIRPSRCCAPSSPRTCGPPAWPARARASNRSSCPSSEETDHDQPAARGPVRDPPHRSRPALPRRQRARRGAVHLAAAQPRRRRSRPGGGQRCAGAQRRADGLPDGAAAVRSAGRPALRDEIVHNSLLASGRGAFVGAKTLLTAAAVTALSLPYGIAALIGLATGEEFAPAIPTAFSQLLAAGGEVDAARIGQVLAITVTCAWLPTATPSVCLSLAFRLRPPLVVMAVGFVWGFHAVRIVTPAAGVDGLDALVRLTPFAQDHAPAT